MNNPLVSVITPTANRPELLRRCIDQFLAQDYANKEMVIVHDNMEDVPYGGMFPMGVIRIMEPGLIGYKRNLACKLSVGEIIVHMDDDDLYAPDWITRSVAALGYNDLTGLSSAYFLQPGKHLWQYTYGGKQPYVLGATMCYWKKTWERNQFKTHVGKKVQRVVRSGEDALFCANAGHIAPHDYIEGFTAIMHGKNTAMHEAFRLLRGSKWLKELELNTHHVQR